MLGKDYEVIWTHTTDPWKSPKSCPWGVTYTIPKAPNHVCFGPFLRSDIDLCGVAESDMLVLLSNKHLKRVQDYQIMLRNKYEVIWAHTRYPWKSLKNGSMGGYPKKKFHIKISIFTVYYVYLWVYFRKFYIFSNCERRIYKKRIDWFSKLAFSEKYFF